MRTSEPQQHRGHCQCGQTTFKLTLPQSLENYSPRACDCEFCRRQHIAYLSNPDGELLIQCAMRPELQQQGDELAVFVTCNHCKSVIAACLINDPQAQTKSLLGRGAVNANLLANKDALQAAEAVSPRLLTPEQKLARWQELWLRIRIDWLN